MQEFIAIDFETANPKRVSACALGYAKVRNCEIIETNEGWGRSSVYKFVAYDIFRGTMIGK